MDTTSRLTTVMHVSFSHLTMDEAVAVISARIAQPNAQPPLKVFTPNSEQLMLAREDTAFLSQLQQAEVRVPDTVGMVIADWWRAFLTGSQWNIRERVAGVDLAERLCLEAARLGWKVALVGGKETTAQRAVTTWKKRLHELQIWSAPAAENVAVETGVDFRQTLQALNQIQPDLLLVGFGAPKQEQWVLKHAEELPAKVVMVVGGTLDMWAGNVQRAPRLFRLVGLEWLWRFIQEPWRIKRIGTVFRFGWLILWGKW